MNLHPVACTRCRTYKRKCSRELPACYRCRRLGFDCGYPPARRKLAVDRPSRDGPGSSQGTSSVLKHSHLATEVNGLMVFDSYFSLFIPSCFIFNQPRVKRRYVEGNIPSFVRDSIFSIALMLLESRTARSLHLVDETRGGVGTNWSADLWAERASMAAKQAVRPTLDTVQTFYNLAVYWCAVGKTTHFEESANSAMQSAQQVAVRSPRLLPAEASELKQSCFWIAMTCRCLLKNDAIVSSFDSVLEDQLSVQEDILPQCPEVISGSYLRGRIMKFAHLWLKIRQFVCGLYDDAHPGMQLATLIKLDTNVCCLYETLPLQYMNFDGLRCDRESESDDLVSLQTIYHLCRILPHLAMITFLRKQGPWAKAHIQSCSKLAARHINQISDLFTNCLSIRHSFPSALPSLVAYCSLISSSVYLTYVKAIQSRRKGSGSFQSPAFRLLRKRLLSNLHLINKLRNLWAPVKAMWDVLQADMESARISNNDIDEFLKELRASFEWKALSMSPTVSVCPKRQAEYFMVTNLPQVMESIILFDPGYILAGILQPFPRGANPKEWAASPFNNDSPSGSLEKDFLLTSGRTWKLPLHPNAQGPQQTGRATTQYDRYVQPDRGQMERSHNFVPEANPETTLPEDDPNAVKGMMEMMWLDGNELLI